MSRRKRLIVTTLLLCSAPVLAAVGWILLRGSAAESPYVPGAQEEGITNVLERSGEAAAGGLRFTEVDVLDFRHFPHRRTSQLPEDMGSGAAWGDYDGDGLWDLYLVNIAAPLDWSEEELASSEATDRLYRNRGDGTFEDATEAAGLARPHRGMGASWADYDGDGDLDLFVTCYGENLLWENRGDGTFRDATQEAGLAETGFWSGSDWSDFDGDGDLDLYVAGYVRYTPEDPDHPSPETGDPTFPFTLNPSSYPPHTNRLYVNRGDGTFEEAAAQAGVLDERGRGLEAAWADLDADGRPDLYVANDVSDNALYRNRGDGTFENVSYQAVVADYRGAMGLAVGDWDGDLDLDLFITHWIAQENALYTNLLRETAERGEGTLRFADEADRVGLGQPALDLIGWGTAFADLDADGRADLVVVNGSTFQERDDPTKLRPMHPHLYRNLGPEEGFFEVGEQAGIRTDPPGVGRGLAVADYDADGDLDLLITRHSGRARLLRNDTPQGHRLALRLEATQGHPSGTGAHVSVEAGDLRRLQEAGAGASYLSQNASDLFFGLGEEPVAERITVVWPGGARDTWTGVEADRLYLLRQGQPPQPLSQRWVRAGDDAEETPSASQAERARSLRRFWALKRRADRLLVAERWAEAEALLVQVLRHDPAHEDSLYALGNVRLEQGRYAEALGAFEELVQVNEASSRGWVQIGTLHAIPEAGGLFDLEAAARAFARAHELNPEESGPIQRWGEVLLATGERRKAAELLERAWRMNDQAPSPLLLSGWIAWKEGRPEQARRLLEKAAAALAGPEDAGPLVAEGETRGPSMEASRRRAARRRLFGSCLEELGAAAADPDPARAFGCVDRTLDSLP